MEFSFKHNTRNNVWLYNEDQRLSFCICIVWFELNLLIYFYPQIFSSARETKDSESSKLNIYYF